MMELWVPSSTARHHEADAETSYGAHLRSFTAHAWKWLIATAFTCLYLCLLYFTWVPSWIVDYGPETGLTISCDTRGDLTPACAATGYYDRLLFGQKMCRSAWMSARLPACSSCS